MEVGTKGMGALRLGKNTWLYMSNRAYESGNVTR